MNKDVYKLTKPQMSIYLSEEFTDCPINNIVGTIYFKNDINLDLLKLSVNLMSKHNQALRTMIVKKGSTPMQYFKEYKPFDIAVHDFTNKTMEDFRAFQEKYSQEMFDIYENDLFIFVICLLPNGEVALIGKFHHLISDAWSLGLIIDNIACFYTRLANDMDMPGDLGYYTDFIKREQDYLASDIYEKNKTFWKNALKNIEPVSLKSSSASSFEANRVEFELSLEETNLINNFCKQNRISAYAFFLAVLDIYFYRVTPFKNFTIQTPVLNRIGKEKNTIGMFINMISIPLKNDKNLTVSNLLQSISSDSLAFLRNSKYPYMDFIEEKKKTDNVQNYNVVYSFQNMRPNTDFPNLVPYHSEWNFTKYMQDEFVVNITDINNSGKYIISYDYLTKLFTAEDVELIHKRIKTIALNIINNPDAEISKLEILPKAEQKLLLNDFNNTNFNYDTKQTFIDLFEEAVRTSPSNTALIFQDIKYTYAELNNMANIVANELEKRKVKNSRVAILCKKSAWQIAALIGIMKSGNCYIPIDAEYPEERIKYIMSDSDCSCLITSEEYKNLFDFDNKLILDGLDLTLTINYTSVAKPSNLAYMIYTSGTTGKPKGVQIKHKNILNTLIWRKDFYTFNENHVVLQIPSFAFDSSVEDIFTPLISGATLVIPSVTRMDVNIIAEEIKKYNVNHFLVVPSLYKILLHERLEYLSSLEFITIAGESFPLSLVKEHFKKLPNVRLVNEYGPTENSVCSTYYELTANDDVILIGKPIYNCKCYILDENLELLPIGSKGELYVSGPGVSLRILEQR